ncbi:MAG TPA: nodulation protein NfeD [Actinomycetota bacterium]|nr:nodulation protein NfeD [Actinomycetota bacterium]
MTTTRLGHAARLTSSIALVILGLLAGSAGAQSPTAGSVVRLHLDGVVDPFISDYLRNGIAEAAEAGAAAVLIEIDTPGGLVSSTREITQAILNAEVPVLCYVTPSGARAASAGSFVLLSCNIAAMAPGTNVGAATPVGIDGAVGSDKAVNDAAASMRSIAEQRDRNADVAETFVTDAVSISAEQALDDDVIDVIAPTTADLIAEVDGRTVTLGDGERSELEIAGAPLVDRSMGGFVGFLHTLLDPTLAFIFFWLGLALIVLELLVPGHIFSGTIGTALLILAIVSFGVLPVQLIGVLLLVAAATLMVIELNAPGFGAWGIAGTICLLLGGWFLYDRAGGVVVAPGVLIGTAVFVGVFFAIVLRKVLRVRRLPPAQGTETVVGKQGVAIGTGLNPDGIVRVSSEEWRATTSDGSTIPAGTPVRVTQLDGLTLIVESAPAELETAGSTSAEEERSR